MNVSFKEAEEFYNQGKIDKSKEVCQKILSKDAKDINALLLLSVIAYETGHVKKSMEILNYSIKIYPNSEEFFFNKSYIEFKFLKNKEESLNNVNMALSLNSKYIDALNLKGLILTESKAYKEAVSVFRKIINLNSQYIYAYKNMYSIYKLVNDSKNCTIIIDEAKKNLKNLFDFDLLKAEICINEGDFNQSVKHLNSVIKLKDNFSKAIFLRAVASEKINNNKSAEKDYLNCIKLEPYNNLYKEYFFRFYYRLKKIYKSLYYVNEIIKNNKNHPFIFGTYIFTKNYLCDWDNYENNLNNLKKMIESDKKVSKTFHILSLYNSPKLELKAAQIENSHNSFNFKNNLKINKKNKIRIGYYSTDFHDHAVMNLFKSVLEIHDKEKFELYGFSFNTIKDEMNLSVKKYFDKYFDITSETDEQISNLSKENSIDIAIDLKGYTFDHRFKIFELGCAPIQVNFLGYPGTTGSKNIDYIIADKILIPEKNREFFSEKIIYMPDTYQPNDKKKLISNKIFKKSDFGLEENKIILGSFNNSYKITPYIYKIWMEILKENNDAVLWIYADNDDASLNLIKNAKNFKVDDRIIIARRTPLLSDHLKRITLVDLCLDTYPCNGHTTTSDVLRSGVPIVTLIGDTFASRVSASLLNTINANELVAKNINEYKNIILSYLNDKKKLTNIKKKIQANIIESSLFNTENYTKNLEKAYLEIYNKKLNGLSTDNIFL